MVDAEEDWAADRLDGSEPSAAPPTETLVAEEAEMPGDATGPDEAVDLDAGAALADVEEPPDVNAGAKMTAMVLCGALPCAVAVIAAALVTSSGTAPPPTRSTPPFT